MYNKAFGQFPISLFPNKDMLIDIILGRSRMMFNKNTNISLRFVSPTTFPSWMFFTAVLFPNLSMRTCSTSLRIAIHRCTAIYARMRSFPSPTFSGCFAFSSITMALLAILCVWLRRFKGTITKWTYFLSNHIIIILQMMSNVE